MEKMTEEELALRNGPGLRLALNARSQGIRPELLLGLMILADLCWSTRSIVVITHILDGQHMRNSLHYAGAAVDFVIDFTGDQELFVNELRERLGFTYDVIAERDHIHIEYQPHLGAIT